MSWKGTNDNKGTLRRQNKKWSQQIEFSAESIVFETKLKVGNK